MGLLNDQDFDMQGYGGLLGPLLYRNPSSDEATLAQWARDAAAAQLARSRGGSRTYGAASGPVDDILRAGIAPFGFAGPGSLNFASATNEDAQGLKPFETPDLPEQRFGLSSVPPGSNLSPTGLTQDEVARAHRAKADAAARARGDVAARLGQFTNDVARSAANGVPVIGAFNNRINAVINASIAPVLNPMFDPKDQLSEPSWRERYDHSLRDQNGAGARFSEDHPYLDGAANFAGGALASGGVAGAVPWAARAGAPLAVKVIRDFGTQAALGAADALARGDDVEKGMERGMARGAGRELRNGILGQLLPRIRP
jgi:hypothetical protein